MTRGLLSVATLALALVAMTGCGGDATSGAGSTSGAGTSSSGSAGGGSSVSGGSTGSTAPMGHSLTLNAKFVVDGGQVAFMTPSIVVTKVPVDTLVGKHYVIGVYPAGFSPGNDPALDSMWGIVPESLEISYTTPATYKDGPYDIVLVVYRGTEITPDIISKPVQFAPPAQNGDLATFSIEVSVVHMGDPKPPAGVIRVNVAGADASLSVENRWPMDPKDMMQVAQAFTNTVLLLP